MNAHQFQNALRIMYSLDEVSTVLTPNVTKAFHQNPAQMAIRLDPETWAKVYALIEARQTPRTREEEVEGTA